MGPERKKSEKEKARVEMERATSESYLNYTASGLAGVCITP